MIKVLDHGYIKFIEAFGRGEAGEDFEVGIIEAARQSTQKGFRGWGASIQCEFCGISKEDAEKQYKENNDEDGRYPECAATGEGHRMGPHGPPGDEKLLRYLHSNGHSTPFEFSGLIIEVQAPIFVFREWFTHRTQSRSEMSARYEPLPCLDYVPTLDRAMIGASATNKQAGTIKTAIPLTEDNARRWLLELEGVYERLEDHYQTGLNIGIPKELARIALPVGRYSRMRVQANLRNWLHFLSLRMSPNAQWEIRQYANALGEIIAVQFPRTWELFKERK